VTQKGINNLKLNTDTNQYDKINDFIESMNFDSNEYPLIKHESFLSRLISFNLADTNGFSGLSKKVLEFHNTLLKFILGTKNNSLSIEDEKKILSKDFKKFYSMLEIDHIDPIHSSANSIYVDITFTLKQNSVTGIPRVVSEIVRNGIKLEVIPFIIRNGECYIFDSSQNDLIKLNIRKYDLFLFADAGWNYFDDLMAVMQQIKCSDARSVVLIYDLIPLIFPRLSNQNHINAFNNWLQMTLLQCNRIVCISNSVAIDLKLFLKQKEHLSRNTYDIGWVHLGSDFKNYKISNKQTNMLSTPKLSTPYFLSVGTIEPRKAYSISIAAFEMLWDRGIDVTYIIVGKYGWSQSKLVEAILGHREYGRRLFWLDAIGDDELHHLYVNAIKLISSSLCEGFGLPIIEAAHHNLGSIVSDIPVFREIGGETTRFFEVTNSLELARLVEEALKNPREVPKIPFYSWSTSVDNLLSIIKSNSYQYKNY
jgi:glycosyltransferase involved in cell wall biosynthesis